MAQSLARTLSNLEARRAELLRAIDSINQQLADVAKATAAAAASRRAGGGSVRRTGAKRAWFERNEAPALLRTLAKAPAAPVDLVHELARRKNYARRLRDEDARRFEGAAYMAIAQAVKTGVLRKQRDGRVVAK